ncbi:hypothetical protein IMCC20628_02539 [Hoeflea sp. IMCC20628]|nr:hypothetical protein IMCC20628_02539 [Hoeflea sp. IMCC20628]
MTTILSFDPSRCRPATQGPPGRETLHGTADVLMFTGVRREPLNAGTSRYAPRHHEPMFDDPAPAKPSGKNG